MGETPKKRRPGYIDLDELQMEAEKLLSLLKDRQHGLISWNLSLLERIEDIHRITSSVVGGTNKPVITPETVEVKMVEFHWTIDTSMDPYARAGAENEYQLAIFIPGEECPDVLVLAADTPIFYEMSPDNPGKNLSLKFNIQRREREFVELYSFPMNRALILEARMVATSTERFKRTGAAFKTVFEAEMEDD